MSGGFLVVAGARNIWFCRDVWLCCHLWSQSLSSALLAESPASHSSSHFLRSGTSGPFGLRLIATVAPVVDYASSVWMHECQYKAARPIHRIQKTGAQAIIGTFMTVTTSVAEAKAHIVTLQGRFWRKAIKTWTDIHTFRHEPPTQLHRQHAQVQKLPPVAPLSSRRRTERDTYGMP